MNVVTDLEAKRLKSSFQAKKQGERFEGWGGIRHKGVETDMRNNARLS